MKKIAVVPTNRPELLTKALAQWQRCGGWDELIVVEDGPEATIPGAYCWRDIDQRFGDQANLVISRKDSAIRSFGFLMAYERGADLIATFDDDCLPLCDDWMGGHAEAIAGQPAWASTVPGLSVRGIPYRNRGKTKVDVGLNIGLWSGVPDLDAIGGLVAPVNEFAAPSGTRLLSPYQFVPMCGMNLAFTRDLAPLMWFPVMGQHSPYRRFDDIWCGIIAKHICDHLGVWWSVGEPIVRHTRASCYFANLQAEAPGIAANESMWEMIARCPIDALEPVDCMRELALHLEPLGGYSATMSRGMRLWANQFAA